MQKRDSRESKGESRVSWTKINDCHSDNPHSAADLHFIRLAFFTSFWQEILRKNQRRTLLPSFDVVDSVSWNEGCVLESRVLSGDRRLVNRCRHLSFHLFLVSHPPAFFFLTLLTIFFLSLAFQDHPPLIHLIYAFLGSLRVHVSLSFSTTFRA